MARITTTFTVSLLPEMFEQLEQVRAVEHRTRSELVREALRVYIAIKRGRPEAVLESSRDADIQGEHRGV